MNRVFSNRWLQLFAALSILVVCGTVSRKVTEGFLISVAASFRPEYQIDDLLFSPDGKLLATCRRNEDRRSRMPGEIKQIDLWDTKTGTHRLNITVNKACRYLSFSPDGRLLLGQNG